MKLIKQFWILTLFLIVANLIIYLTITEGDFLMYFSDILPMLCSFIAIVGIYKAYNGFKTSDKIKTAWLMIMIGVVLDFVAEVTYGVLEIGFAKDMDEFFPSFADVFWCLAYIPFIWGLIILYFEYGKSGFPHSNIKTRAALILFFCLISVAIIYYVLIPIVQDTETNVLSKTFSLFYPISDIITATIALILLSLINQFGKSPGTTPWLLLSLGFLLFTVSDLLFAYITWQSSYENGSFIDLGWNLGYLLIGMSGLYQRRLVDSITEKE